MHEGDALFLAGHPLPTYRTSIRQFLWLVVCTHFHPDWCMMEMRLFWLDIFYLLALRHLWPT